MSPFLIAAAVLVTLVGVYRYIWSEARLVLPLLADRARVGLSFSPDQFDGVRFHLCFFKLVLSSVLLRLGALRRTKMVGLEGKEADAAPPNTYDAQGVRSMALDMPFRLRPEHFRAYSNASESSTPLTLDECRQNPLRLQLLLTGLVLPSIAIITAKRGCPFDPIGTVHVRSRVEIASHDKCLKALEEDIARPPSKQAGLKIMTRCGTRATKVKRGREWVIVCELLDARGGILYRHNFVLLEFARHASPPVATSSDQSVRADPPASMRSIGTVPFTVRDPQLWAVLSKDKNPIHFSTLAAKALGLRARVAHAYHVVVKGAELLPEGASHLGGGKKGSWHEVEVRRPTFLPSRLDACVLLPGEDNGGEMELRNKEKVNVALKWGSI